MEIGSAEIIQKTEKPLGVKIEELSEFAKTLPKRNKPWHSLDEQEKQELRRIEDEANQKLRENSTTIEASLVSPQFFSTTIDILKKYMDLNGGRYPNSDFRDELSPIIRRNFSSIQKALDRNKGKGSDVLMRILTDGIVEAKDEDLELIFRNFLSGYKESEEDSNYDHHLLRQILGNFDKESPERKDKIRKFVIEILNSQVDEELKRTTVENFISEYDYEKEEALIYKDRLNSLLEPLGLDVDLMINAWKNSYLDSSDLQMERIFTENIIKIYELERKRPGSVRILHQMFGIRDFMRYPVQMLTSQYDKRYDSTVPYGIVLFPRVDHNGAFSDDQKLYLSLFGQMSRLGYAIRVYECENKLDLIHAVNSARHAYGKIHFALIGGHGSEDSIEFGGAEHIGSDNILRIDDLIRRGAPSVSRAFIENPTVILSSCSTGVERGIGQTISNLGTKVIAPDSPASISRIKVGLNGGTLSFEVKYSEEGKINKSIARVYEKGEKVA